MNDRGKIEEAFVFDLEGIKFRDLFNIGELQRFQDLFADTHDVASIITHPDGTPLTNPSNFTRLCKEVIRKTEKGCRNCFQSDSIPGRYNPSGPIIQPCLYSGLLVAAVSITVGGKHIATWLIGQVRNDDLNEEQVSAYAGQIGVTLEEYKNALNEVPKMSVEKFNKIAQLLFNIAHDLSTKSDLILKLQIQESELIKTQKKDNKLNESPEGKQMEVLLLESKQQYENLVSNIPAGVYILHTKPEGTFKLDYASPKMAEMLDLSIESLLASGETVFKAIHPDDLDGFVRLNIDGIIQKRPFDWKGRTIIRGDVRWMHFRSRPQELENGDTLWHGLIVDITERMMAEAEIKYQNSELVRLDTEKDKFFSIIAHDLRSPFNSFLGLTQIMAEDLPSLTMAQIQDFSIKLSKSATNLYGLLENLLEWSKMKNGAFIFTPEVIHLRLIVDGCIDLLQVSAKIKDIEITNDIVEGIEVLADRNMIQTIIRNLLSNAIKFTPRGGKVRLSAKVSDNKFIEIAIIDSGIGMSRELITNLFRIDKKTNRLGTENEPSSGLGLLLCKEFVEKQDGKIRVKSEVGEGSTFSFSIPKA